MWKQALGVAAIVAAFGLSYYQTYQVGKGKGAKEVYAEWSDHETKRTSEINTIREELALLMGKHQQIQQEYEHELSLAYATFEAELSGYRIEYDHRLQLANDRAGVYQRKANGSEVERQDLARHAAELDRTLEEGRGLVRELGATLRQREVTIKALGGIILNDRTLLE